MSVVASLPGSLPVEPIGSDVDPVSVAKSLAFVLENLRPEHLATEAIWRDTFALTSSMRTFYSPSSISTAWKETSKQRNIQSLVLGYLSATIQRHPSGAAWIDCPFTFVTQATPSCSCAGIISVVPDVDGEWKIWILRTVLQQLNGQLNVDLLEPQSRPDHVNPTQTFDCVIVGGGPAGLSTAGRMKAMGLSYVCIDQHKSVGDNWGTRYDSARLHTVRAYAHLPFDKTFPPTYQEFLTGRDLARGYSDWAAKFGINTWQDTQLVSGEYQVDERVWTLALIRNGASIKVKCRHVVLCVGAGGQIPIMPEFPGRDQYKGTVLHSAEYQHARNWKGKHGVVVGTANTAHDVANDMLEAGCASVTMVQRNRTYVIPIDHYVRGARVLYNEDIPTNTADFLFFSPPLKFSSLTASAASNKAADTIPAYFEGLERAGFKVAPHGDVVEHVYERAGGHYLDVGVSQKIIDGKIKMKSDALIDKFTTGGLGFDDGSELKGDVIVFTTGFEKGVKGLVRKWFGDDVAGQASDFGGLDEEGEVRGLIRPTGHSSLWSHGTSVGSSRYHSRFIALQIKADLMGTPLPIYGRQFPIEKRNVQATSNGKVA